MDAYLNEVSVVSQNLSLIELQAHVKGLQADRSTSQHRRAEARPPTRKYARERAIKEGAIRRKLAQRHEHCLLERPAPVLANIHRCVWCDVLWTHGTRRE